MSDAAAEANQQRDNRLIAAVAADPALAAYLQRQFAPGAEPVVVNVYTTRDGQIIQHLCGRNDMDGMVAEATWASAFYRDHPGTSCLTFGEVINRREIAKAAWSGANASLQRVVFRKLDNHHMAYCWRFFTGVIDHMPLADLAPHLSLQPYVRETPTQTPASSS